MFFPIQCFTHYSITEAFAKPEELAKKAHELKLPGIAITDFHSLSGCIEFYQSIEKLNKKSEHKVKPVFGVTLKVDANRYLVLSKNINGWKSLIKLVSSSKISKEGKYLELQDYKNITDNNNNIICIDLDNNPYIFRPVYYTNSKDLILQRIMICIKMKTTLGEIKELIGEAHQYSKFFTDPPIDYSLTYEKGFESTLPLLDQIENYSITRNPIIPKFTFDPQYKSSDDMLYDLCRKGWVTRRLNHTTKNDPKLRDVYVARIKEELKAFVENGLSDYILIIRDIMKFVRDHNQKCGLRGSSVGCLVSYLIDISHIDPVKPDPVLPYAKERELLFSRFFNSARVNSLMDVDLDVPMSFRSKLVKYIEDKYGKECVAHIITFGRMDGKGAIKEVFRVVQPVPNSVAVANDITKKMVDTSKVQDIIEEEKEENPKYSVIDYCIENFPEVAQYATEYEAEFNMAKELASTIRSTGIHAAGIVIGNQPLDELFPLSYSKDGIRVVALEMVDLEAAGGCKYDLLSVAAYEKIGVIERMINEGLTEVPLPDEEIESDERTHLFA